MRVALRFSLVLAILLMVCSLPAASQAPSDQSATTPLDPQTQSQLAELAGRVLSHADKAKCHAKSCTILVTNFTDRYGGASMRGTRLADAISAQLAIQAKDIQIIERRRLRDFLQEESIPSNQSADDRANAWLASRFSASAVLVGTLKREETGFQLQVRLLDVQDTAKKKHQQSVMEEVTFPQQSADALLALTEEPFAEGPRRKTTSSSEDTYMAGRRGASMPSCYYKPDPPYSDQARAAKFTGKILLLVTIRLDQGISDIRIVRGAPFGLNDEVRKTVATWKCTPASYNGTPVVTRVPIEITFRLH